MDLYYIEEGYYDTGYFVYTADAESVISSNFSISCDAENIEGSATVEASGSWTSAATVNATANVGKQSEASITSQSTVSISITRIQEASAAFTSAFSPLLTVEVFKNSFAVLDVPSTLSATPAINRSITQTLDTIASLNAMAEKLHGFTVSIDSTASFTADASKITGGVAELNSQFALDSITNPIIEFSASLESQATQTSTATKTSQVSSSLSTTSTVSCLALNVQLASATLNSRFTQFTSRYLGSGRPRTLTSVGTFSSTAKYGSNSLQGGATTQSPGLTTLPSPKAGQDWVYESYVYPTQSTITAADILDFAATLFLNVTVLSNRTVRITLRAFAGGGFTVMYTATSSAISVGAWHHITVVKNSTQLSFYVDGTRVGTQLAYTGWDSYSNANISFLTERGRDNLFLDESSVAYGTTYGHNPSATTITVPTTPRVNDPATTQYLHHWEGNGVDDTSVQQFAVSTLSANATVSAQANPNTKQAAAGLNSTATVTASGSILQEAASTLTSAFSQTALVDRFRQAQSDLESVATVTALIGSIKQFEITAGALFEPSVDVDAQLAGVALLESQFTQEATAVKTTDIISNIDVVASQSATATVTAGLDSALVSDTTLSTTATRIQTDQADLVSEFAITINNSAIEQYSAAVSTEFACTVVANKFVGYVANLSSAFASSTQIERTRDVATALSVSTALTATVIRQQQISGELASEFTQTTDVVKLTDVNAMLLVNVLQTTTAVKTVNPQTDFSSIASQLSVAAKNATGTITLESRATLTAVVGQLVNLGLFSSGLDTTNGRRYLATGGASDSSDLLTISFWAKRDSLTRGYRSNILRQQANNQVTSIIEFVDRDGVVIGTSGINFSNAVYINAPFAGQVGAYWQDAVPQDTRWHHYLVRNVRSSIGIGTRDNWSLWIDGELQTMDNPAPNGISIGGGFWNFRAYIGSAGTYDSFNSSLDDENFDGAMAQFWAGSISVDDFAVDKFYLNGPVDLGPTGQGLDNQLNIPAVYNLLDQPWLGVTTEFNPAVAATEPLYNAVIRAQATLTVTVTTAVFVVINSSSTSSLGCAAGKTTDSTATFTAQATLTAVAAQTIGVISNQSSQSTLSAQVFRIQQGASTQTAETTVTALIGSIKPQSATLDTTAELTCDYTVILAIQGSAELSSEFTLTAAVNERQGFIITPSSEFQLECDATLKPPIRITADLVSSATLTTDLTRVQAFAIALSSEFTQSTDAVKLRQMAAELTATATQTLLAGYKVDIQALLQVQAFELTQADVLNLDPALTYVIPQETREFIILAESRLYAISEETREFMILAELRLFEIGQETDELIIL